MISPTRLSFRTLAATLMLAAGTLTASVFAAQAQEGLTIPAPTVSEAPNNDALETAVLAGGCFWGVQGVYQHTEGVKNAVSGYAGGEKKTAIYEVVGSGMTGHAEAVKITYDPKKISYGKLLQIYFSVAHDPTQLNRQGPDRGTQYRSAIFPQNDEQAKVAKAYIAQLNEARVYKAAIVTKIEPGKEFFPAEGYHQDYLTLHPTQPYIVFNDLPKIKNLERLFPDIYRAKPALVSDAKS
jgi:peptide-methionine (S)-S-oxide reductase